MDAASGLSARGPGSGRHVAGRDGAEVASEVERIGHPRRGGKPEFKEGRYPPLDAPACSHWCLSVEREHRDKN